MSDVQFGILQRLKTQDYSNNPEALKLQKDLKAQESIFDQAKDAYEDAVGESSGETGGSVVTFAGAPMSVEELEAAMLTEQEKLERLIAALQEQSDKPTTPPTDDDEDKGNDVKPKEFGFLA